MTLLGLLGLGILIGVPYLLVSHWRLKTRVKKLEKTVTHLATRAGRDQTVGTEDANSAADVEISPESTEQTPDPGAKSGLPWGARQSADQSRDLGTPVVEGTIKDTPPERDALMAGPAQASEDPSPATTAAPPRAFVMRQDLLDQFSSWLRDNWVLAAGAASLALAGIFLVQYGAEHGLLTPFWRVMAALGFGGALIVGGEVIRRRFGDEGEGTTQYLPSALAGAGLITLFAGVLSARVMYGLIDPGATFAVLCLVSLLALVLGWFYGALLTALGLVGASAAPFLVGGQSQAAWMLYYYFALIAAVGLGVDTIKRWAWVSVLALVTPVGAAWLLYASGAGEPHFLAALLLMAAAAVILPERSLAPLHGGAAVFDTMRNLAGKRIYPEFPTRLSAAMVAVVTAAALMVALQADMDAVVILALSALVVLLLACLIWMRAAPALFDHALLPGVGLLVLILLEGLNHGRLWRDFQAAADRAPEVAVPQTVWVLVAIGALGSVLGFLRMQWSLSTDQATEQATETEGENRAVFWALAGAVFAPTLVLVLEFTWAPAWVLGDYPWALVVLALAALMTLLAERTAQGVGQQQRPLRVALFAIAALTLIALALFLLLAQTALTLALAVMVVLVVLIDRKFDLPVLELFVQIGVAVITYRLVLDPGFTWALDRDYIDDAWRYVTPIPQILLAYLGTLVLLALAWIQARGSREKTALILESAGATIAAVFVSVLILRLLPESMRDSHAGLGLLATVWTASLMNQLYRMQASGVFSKVLRSLLALGYGLAALGSLVGLMVFSNPLLSSQEQVLGPLLLDSLAAAYLPLAAVFAIAALRLNPVQRWLRLACAVLASLLAAFYVTLEIRRFWRGDDLSVSGVSDPELYSYTVALLLVSAAVLMLAFWRRSVSLRKLAMAGVVLTIAKVFLVDMSGLSGLTRVFSFMGLGLALVGLAWLNRMMTAQWQKGADADQG